MGRLLGLNLGLLLALGRHRSKALGRGGRGCGSGALDGRGLGHAVLVPPRPWTGCSGARAGRRAATRAWSARNRGAPRGAGKAWHGQIKRPEIGEGADPAIHATMPAAMSLAVAKSTKNQNFDSPARPEVPADPGGKLLFHRLKKVHQGLHPKRARARAAPSPESIMPGLRKGSLQRPLHYPSKKGAACGAFCKSLGL